VDSNRGARRLATIATAIDIHETPALHNLIGVSGEKSAALDNFVISRYETAAVASWRVGCLMIHCSLAMPVTTEGHQIWGMPTAIVQ
jgi:hypothetical protein